ncbi:MAG: radical SAM protein [Lachnospiraceae bacterium]|nr:radical SAM protein [Lachnospiraceae bacterium]
MTEKRMSIFKRNLILKDGSSLSPTRAVFYPTYRCNLHCRMCYQNSHNRFVSELSIEDIKKIFTDSGIKQIHLVGGEIFVRKDIYDMLRYFDSTMDYITIQTNGTLITDGGAELINEMDNIKEMWFSLDGLRDSHDLIRGKGAFDKTITALKRFIGFKSVVINSVIMESNIDDMPKLYELADSMGVDKVVFQFEMKYDNEALKRTSAKLELLEVAGSMNDDCVKDKPNFEYIGRLKGIIEKLRAKENKTKIAFLPEVFENDLDSYAEGTIFNGKCVACRDILNSVVKIDPEGRLMICEALQTNFGSVLDKSIECQWNDEKVRAIRQKLIGNNLVELCSRCCCLEII